MEREVAGANVAWAADQARVRGASIMIEAVNSYGNGPYLLDTTAKAVDFLDAVPAAALRPRSEPGSGEISYRFVLDLLERSGYGGWVGLEYNLSTATTEESLGWIKELGYA